MPARERMDPGRQRLCRLVVASALVWGFWPPPLRGSDLEGAGVAAEQAGRLREAFDLYLAVLQGLPDPPPADDDERLRERIVKLAQRLDPQPDVPEDAKRSAVRGQLMFGDATEREGYLRAEAEFRRALRGAPWFGAAIFNLALVQQNLEEYREALANMRLYLLTSPADEEQARAKIYELEYRLEQRRQRMRNYSDSDVPSAAGAALAFLKEACGLEVARACYQLAAGPWVPADERARATLALRQACDGGAAAACTKSGDLDWLAGRHPSESEAAQVLYRRGCEGGDAEGCFSLGLTYGRKESAASAVWFQKACDGKHAVGCYRLAGLYASGKGVAKNRERAAELYRAACALGDEDSCVRARDLAR